MVRRIIDYLTRDVSGLHNAAYLLALSAILSQSLGLIRDRLLASNFGAGSELDVYYASFRLPDFIFVAVGSFVSVSVLIPFILERLDEPERRARFLNAVLSLFSLLIAVSALVAFFTSPILVRLLFPGFSEILQGETVALTRVLLLSPFFLGLSNLAGALVQSYRKFFLYALSPLFYNAAIILGILFLYPLFGLVGLAYGVVFGAFLHLVIQLPFLLREKLVPRLSFDWVGFSEMRRLIAVSLPRSLALSLNQLVLLALTFFASVMGAGAIAVFNLSFNLQSVPLSVFAVSYSVAAFPMLARLFSLGNHEQFLRQITAAARHIIFWSVPAMVLLIVLRAQVVRTILGAGVFDWTDTRLTAACLALFSVSLLPQGFQLLFLRGYYAIGDTRTPLAVGLLSSIATVIASAALIWSFSSLPVFRAFVETILNVEDIPGTAVLMLPLAYSIGIILNAVLLWTLFGKNFTPRVAEIASPFFKILSASVIMGTTVYGVLKILGGILNLDTFVGIFFQGLAAGLAGIVVLIGMLVLLRDDEFKEVLGNLKKRLAPEKVIGEETKL